jgi:hypothetical protein
MSAPIPQIIGIDISKTCLDRHVHPAGIERQFANTTKGHKSLLSWLGQWQVERVAFEVTATYHCALEAAPAGEPCVQLIPRWQGGSHRLPERSPRRTGSTPCCWSA